MTCGYCGAVVPEGKAYCPVCGAKVNRGLPSEDALADADQEVRPILAEAYLALRRRDFRRAEEKCIEALRHFPNNASAHAMLAEVYEAQGRLDDAIEWLRMALDLDPDNERMKRRLAELQARREERERAKGAEPARPPQLAPPAKRRVWKVAGLVGALVVALVAITYFAGGLAYRGRADKGPSRGGLMAPPEVGGFPQKPPTPPAVQPRRLVPALPPQRPALPRLEGLPAKGPKPSQPQPEKGEAKTEKERGLPDQQTEAPPSGGEAGAPLLRLLPAPPPYTAGTDLQQYLLSYLRHVAGLQKGEAKWIPDWVEVDRNRNFVTVFAHIEGATDRKGLVEAARWCAIFSAASILRSYPPAYWLSVRVRGGHAQGPLLLVADFDRAGMIQALRGAGATLESVATSVWWNPTYLGPSTGHGGGEGP